jgi:hypothetical protein
LRALLRLSVEFRAYLNIAKLEASHAKEDQYQAVSIFSGWKSYYLIAGKYPVLKGALEEDRKMDHVSQQELKHWFLDGWEAFEAETDMLRKCATLLKLFKIQLVFASLVLD